MIVPGFRFTKPVPHAVIEAVAKAYLEDIIPGRHTERYRQAVTEQTLIIR